MISTPATWLEEFTPRDKWVGGFVKDDQEWTTFHGLQQLFWGQFELIGGPVEVPFVIRETSRKYQHSFAQLTVWKKGALES